MPPSPQRPKDNEDVGTNKRVLSWLLSAGIDYRSTCLPVERARIRRDGWSGYHNWSSDYMASSTHQRSHCDDPRLTVLTPPIPRLCIDPGGTLWTDFEQWALKGQSIYVKRKTEMPFDKKTKDGSQPSVKAEFNRALEQSSVKGFNAARAASGKLSLASLRVIQSYLTEIDHVIGPGEGQIDKVYLECR